MDDTDGLEARITELETRYTLQQDTLEQLSDVVWRQQQTIETLMKRIEALEARLRTITESMEESAIDDGPPPHY